MTDVRFVVGGTLSDDVAAFREAWREAEQGVLSGSQVIAFETWDALAGVMTGERYRLLRHLHAMPEVSVSALARSLGRHLRRVQADVRALEGAGLIDRSSGMVRATADRITAEVRLG